MVRWIDASCVLAILLTKQTRADRSWEAIDDGMIDLRPTDASLLLKQKGRAAAPQVSSGDLGEEIYECGNTMYILEFSLSLRSLCTFIRAKVCTHTGIVCIAHITFTCAFSSCRYQHLSFRTETQTNHPHDELTEASLL